MRRLSVRIQEDDYQRLRSLAALQRRSLAALVREAISHELTIRDAAMTSLLDMEPHDSGRMLAGWDRAEIFDEMIGKGH